MFKRMLAFTLLGAALLVTACGGDSSKPVSSSAIRVVLFYDDKISACTIETRDYPIELAGRESWKLHIEVTRESGCPYDYVIVQPVQVNGEDAGLIDTSDISSNMAQDLDVKLAPGKFVLQIGGVATGATITVTDAVQPTTTVGIKPAA